MTTETAYATSVLSLGQGSSPGNYPSSGYADKAGEEPNIGGASLQAWTNQSSGSIGINQFNGSSGDYAECRLDSSGSYEDSDWILLYDFAANLTLAGSDTITDTSFALSRVQGNGTTGSYSLYDQVVQAWIYNGTDFTTGGQGSNLKNTSMQWPQISGTSPTSGNFSTANYDFTTGPTYSNLTNSDWGIMVGVDGSRTSRGSYAFINSGELTITYTASGSAPGQVTGLSVTNDSTNPTTALDLSWSTPSGSPTSYTIQRASTLGGTFSTLATGVTGTSYVDSTCSPGTEYAYEVAGVNGVGTGTYSSAAANFTDPAAPGSLAATPVSGSQINVSWSAPSLGSTVSVVQYTLNRQTNGGSFSSIYTGSTASYSNTGLSAGTTYGYEVDVEVAVNDTSGSGLTGDLTSAFSSVVSASTPGPAAPVPLFGLEGTGACPFGITHPTRRTHIEGVRFQHRNG